MRLNERVKLLESKAVPDEKQITVIINRIVSPGHSSREINYIRSNKCDGKEWWRLQNESTEAFEARAAYEARQCYVGIPWLIAKFIEDKEQSSIFATTADLSM